MSQQVRVLLCGDCSLYQVDIVKKVDNKKWECKVCRQKQTLLKEFFRGSGAECRQKVQELNLQHGQKYQSLDNNTIIKVHKQQEYTSTENQKSKWDNYVDDPDFKSPPVSDSVKLKQRVISMSDDEFPEADYLPITNGTKRSAQTPTVSTKKTCSKWEDFL